jgi:hypothetical protein
MSAMKAMYEAAQEAQDLIDYSPVDFEMVRRFVERQSELSNPNNDLHE